MLALAAVPALVLLAPRGQNNGAETAAGAAGRSALIDGRRDHLRGDRADRHPCLERLGRHPRRPHTRTPRRSPASTRTSSPPRPRPRAAPQAAPGGSEAHPEAGQDVPARRRTADPEPDAGPTSTRPPNPTAAAHRRTDLAAANPAPCTRLPRRTTSGTGGSTTCPVRVDSATLIGSIGLNASLHPDFSSTAWNGGLGYGIPINKVDLSTPTSSTSTSSWDDESDAGPYPIPANPKIEGGSDRHIILWDTEGCDLYELFNARKSSGQWLADSGAIWNLRSNALRPDGWTSADAAGLPILPGLVRYDEVAAGAIRTRIRFTAPHTRDAHIHPARHHAGEGTCAALPPMGLRVRLKASVDISGFGPQARVILQALKRYGMILADNGSPWYITGAPHASWDDDELHDLHELTGADFEVVDTSDFR